MFMCPLLHVFRVSCSTLSLVPKLRFCSVCDMAIILFSVVLNSLPSYITVSVKFRTMDKAI